MSGTVGWRFSERGLNRAERVSLSGSVIWISRPAGRLIDLIPSYKSFMKRRQFLQAGLAVAGTFSLGRDFWKRAYAAPAVPGPSPYGDLLGPDENGLYLPEGFTSRKIAEAYSPVKLANGGESNYLWHRASDGGGVIAYSH